MNPAKRPVPGIKTTQEIGVFWMLLAAALTPVMLVVWVVTAPLVALHCMAAVILSGVTQRDWRSFLRLTVWS